MRPGFGVQAVAFLVCWAVCVLGVCYLVGSATAASAVVGALLGVVPAAILFAFIGDWLSSVFFGRFVLDAQQRAEYYHRLAWGEINPALVCPHCQTRGRVRWKGVHQDKGVSGSKLATAIVTGGLSLLVTGLSRHEAGTQARCDNCGATWII